MLNKYLGVTWEKLWNMKVMQHYDSDTHIKQEGMKYYPSLKCFMTSNQSSKELTMWQKGDK